MFLTNHQLVLLREVVDWDFKVKWCGTLSYTAGDVVVRTVAGTEPTTKVTGFTDGYTTQMSAHA